MAKWWWMFACIAIGRHSNAQYSFQSLRFNEDYTYLQADTARGWYARMKYTPFGTASTPYLSAGGEIRYLYQYYVNEDWGEVPVERYSSFYTRFLFHTDIHFSRHFRLFYQLNSSFAVGRVTPNRPIDENQLDIQQVFFDVSPDNRLTLRIGRQELLYGSQRIISVREGPNNRQSYDAVKISWQETDVRIDAYYSSPVRVQQGIFDDAFNDRERLWSAYAVLNEVPGLRNADLYYIGYYNRAKRYNAGTGRELRHSIGTRIWYKSATWHYDVEALYQFGTWGSQRINAYTASIDAGYTFSQKKMKPAVGLKTEIISGDRSVSDTKMNTFNPLFPRGAYFGLAALIGPLNLIDFHPSFSIKPAKKVDLALDYDVFWRHSLQDGLYGPNVVLIFDGDSDQRFIGHQVGLSAEFQPSAFLKLTPEILWFYPGPYLKDVSPGKQVFFGAFTAQFRF